MTLVMPISRKLASLIFFIFFRNITRWTMVGFFDARDRVYPHFANTNKVTQEYSDMAYAICEHNIALGGYRLAHVLAEIHKAISNNEEVEGFVESKVKESKFK